jgi:hypothetical protein
MRVNMTKHLQKSTGSLVEVFERQEAPEEKDLLALYIKQIARYPLLTAQDEQKIGQGIQVARIELEKW